MSDDDSAAAAAQLIRDASINLLRLIRANPEIAVGWPPEDVAILERTAAWEPVRGEPNFVGYCA